MLRQLQFFIEAIRHHKVSYKKDQCDKDIVKDYSEILKNNMKYNFNAFLKAVAYKNNWFIFQDHPQDTHIKIEGIINSKDTVNYLISEIANLISSYLFNRQTSISFTNDFNEKETIQLLTVTGKLIISYF